MEVTCQECRHPVPIPARFQGELRCRNCGSPVNLDDLPSQDRTALEAASSDRQPALMKPGERAAAASLACGMFFFVPLIAQAPAVLFGLVGVVRLRRDSRRRAAAWAGLLLGLVFGVGWVIVIDLTTAWSLFSGATPSVTARVAGPQAVGTLGYTSTQFGQGSQSLAEMELASRVRGHLKLAYAALHAFRRDMGGWPVFLTQLAPSYLNEETAEQMESESGLVLADGVDPAHDPPDRVVACSRRLNRDDTGDKWTVAHRFVLLLNGTIEARPAQEVENALGLSVPDNANSSAPSGEENP